MHSTILRYSRIVRVSISLKMMAANNREAMEIHDKTEYLLMVTYISLTYCDCAWEMTEVKEVGLLRVEFSKREGNTLE